MKPVEFKGQTNVLSKPSSMTDEQCMPLPVLMGMTEDGFPAIESVWELDDADLKVIEGSKRVRLGVMSEGMPPVYLLAEPEPELDATGQAVKKEREENSRKVVAMHIAERMRISKTVKAMLQEIMDDSKERVEKSSSIEGISYVLDRVVELLIPEVARRAVYLLGAKHLPVITFTPEAVNMVGMKLVQTHNGESLVRHIVDCLQKDVEEEVQLMVEDEEPLIQLIASTGYSFDPLHIYHNLTGTGRPYRAQITLYGTAENSIWTDTVCWEAGSVDDLLKDITTYFKSLKEEPTGEAAALHDGNTEVEGMVNVAKVVDAIKNTGVQA